MGGGGGRAVGGRGGVRGEGVWGWGGGGGCGGGEGGGEGGGRGGGGGGGGGEGPACPGVEGGGGERLTCPPGAERLLEEGHHSVHVHHHARLQLAQADVAVLGDLGRLGHLSAHTHTHQHK